jgi:hypothetical protein
MVVGHLEDEEIFEDDVIHETNESLLAKAGVDGNAGKKSQATESFVGRASSLCLISVQQGPVMSREE